MYKYRILITAFLESINNDEAFNLLQEAGCEMKVRYFDGHQFTEEEIGNLIGDMDGVIASANEPYTRAVLDKTKKLKIISRVGVGYDKIDIQAATQKGIAVTITPDLNSGSVAELAMGLMLCLARNITEHDRNTRKKICILKPGTNINNKILGIIGLGTIGKSLVRIAKGFNVRILACDIAPDKEFNGAEGITLTVMNDVMSKSDFISLHLPLNERTKHLIGEKELKLMKPTAYLINTSRGAIVDEVVLVRALKERWIAGAGLDVFEHEPPWDSELINLDNVVLTPHIGASTEESLSLMGRLAAENVVTVLTGKPSRYAVNPETCKANSDSVDGNIAV